MSKINPLDSAKLAADILSILVAANGRESASTVSESLRGGWRSPYSPESGRRWKGLSNIHEHAEGPLMRARMSDAPRRLDPDIFGCGSREMSERVAGIYALSELLDILADVETTHPERWTLYDSRGRHEGFNSALYAERLALAESLRSFVEGN